MVRFIGDWEYRKGNYLRVDYSPFKVGPYTLVFDEQPDAP